MISKDNWLAEKLLEHREHNIEIAVYESEGVIHDVCVECLDCNEVLVSAEDYEEVANMATVEIKCENLISWVWEHSYNLEEFIRALRDCGFTEEEVVAMSEDEGWDTLGVQTIFEEV